MYQERNRVSFGSNMNYEQLLEKLKTDLPHEIHIIPATLIGWILLVILLVLLIWGMAALLRVYGVWSAHKVGQADLARAQNDQQIQVARAKGRLQASELNKEAEIIDATAVSKSVEIIGTALHNNHGYLQWKWIHMMENTDNSVIYVPTEASLPLLEAGLRKKLT